MSLIMHVNIGVFFAFLIINLLITSLILLLLRHWKRKKQGDDLMHQLGDREEGLKKILEMKHALVSKVNHHLNISPLGITGFSSWINNRWDEFNDEQRKKYSIAVAETADRMIGLMNNILDFSHLNSDNYHLHIEPVNLTTLVLERVQECRALYFLNKKLEFNFDLEPGVIVKGDKYYLQQAIDNLVINAINHSSEGNINIKLGKIKILLSNDETNIEYISQHPNAAEFIIQNDGRAMQEDALLDVFKPFKDNADNEALTDTGVGLALCKKVIDVHEGIIKAENNKNGSGTEFVFLLPI